MENIKPILIQGAMEIEINILKEKIENIEEVIIDGFKFYKGKLEGYPVIISKTEIGIINAAISTLIGIKNFNPSFVINQGTAGASDLELLTNDVVIGENCININSFKTPRKGRKEGCDPLHWNIENFIEGEDRLIKISASQELIEIANKVKDNYKKGKTVFGLIGSGDVWNNEYDRIDWLNTEYGILCEDMETISVYTVCENQKIPVIGVRVISDNERLEDQRFDRNSGIYAQEFALEMCKQYIKEICK